MQPNEINEPMEDSTVKPNEPSGQENTSLIQPTLLPHNTQQKKHWGQHLWFIFIALGGIGTIIGFIQIFANNDIGRIFDNLQNSFGNSSNLLTATPLEGAIAAENEALVLVAEFTQSGGTSLDPTSRLSDILDTFSSRFPTIRTIRIRHPIRSSQEAQQVLDQYNATLLVYGAIDINGVTSRYIFNSTRNQNNITIPSPIITASNDVRNFGEYIFEGMDIHYIIGLLIGQVAYNNADFSDAQVALTYAINTADLNRNDELEVQLAYKLRGDVYQGLENYPSAIDDYTQAIEFNPQYASAYWQRALTYGAQGNYQEALADFDSSINLNPDYRSQLPSDSGYSGAYYTRGNIYRNDGNYELAIVDYTQALELNFEPLEWIYYWRGVSYAGLGQNTLALNDYTEAININPSYFHAYYSRGNLYRRANDFESAITDYTTAITLNYDPLEWIYFWRGVSYRQLENYDLALEDFDQAIELNPNYSEAITARDELLALIEGKNSD